MWSRAVISLRRLNPEFYGGTPDKGRKKAGQSIEGSHQMVVGRP
jgi:hypothetical protein